MTWLFIATVCGSGLCLWILTTIFVHNKSLAFYFNLISIGITCVGIVLFYKTERYAWAGIFACLVLFVIVSLFGLHFNWKEKTGDGPFASCLGQEAQAATILNPKGKIEIQGRILPAMSEGMFITQGSKVKVIRVSSKILIVEKISS